MVLIFAYSIHFFVLCRFSLLPFSRLLSLLSNELTTLGPLRVVNEGIDRQPWTVDTQRTVCSISR